ncbi:MAG: zinc ABC transporter substrate-binding protein [Clostridia bacterium]|nr:zinc ABC transporter substrate-binding protein [Clostridia bacterium]
MKSSASKFLSLLLALLLLPLPSLAGTVVTSFYPIWLLALNLTAGAPDLQVRNLAAPDTGCLHDYQLQTGDMKTLAEADLFLVNGAGMESYLDLVYDAFPALPVAAASDGIPLLYGLDALEIGEAEEDEEEANAHLWLSAANAARMAENLAAALEAQFPANAPLIQENLAALTQRLSTLDAELKEGLSELPHRQIITFHEAFPYFAAAYDLEVVAVVNREPGETLTPAQLAQLVEVIQDLGLPPLFVEPQYEDLSARTLAAETGTKVYTLDPVVTGPEEDVPLDYYETIMRQNMATLQEALGE